MGCCATTPAPEGTPNKTAGSVNVMPINNTTVKAALATPAKLASGPSLQQILVLSPEEKAQALINELDAITALQTKGFHLETGGTQGESNVDLPRNNADIEQIKEQMLAMGFEEYMVYQALRFSHSSDIILLMDWIERHPKTAEEIQHTKIIAIQKELKDDEIGEENDGYDSQPSALTPKFSRAQALHALVLNNDQTDASIGWLRNNGALYNSLSMTARAQYLLQDQTIAAALQSIYLQRRHSYDWNIIKPTTAAELRSMGFLKHRVMQALNEPSVKNKKTAMQFIINHPLTVEQEISAKIDEILVSGFTNADAVEALQKFNNNLNVSLLWLNQSKPALLNHYMYNIKKHLPVDVSDDTGFLIIGKEINFHNPNQTWSYYSDGSIRNFDCNRQLVIKAVPNAYSLKRSGSPSPVVVDDKHKRVPTEKGCTLETKGGDIVDDSTFSVESNVESAVDMKEDAIEDREKMVVVVEGAEGVEGQPSDYKSDIMENEKEVVESVVRDTGVSVDTDEEIKDDMIVEQKEEHLNVPNTCLSTDYSHHEMFDYQLMIVSPEEIASYASNAETSSMLQTSWDIDHDDKLIKNQGTQLFLTFRDEVFCLDTCVHDFDIDQRWCFLSEMDLRKLNPEELRNTYCDEDSECIICFDYEPNVRLEPCGHSSFCQICLNQLKPTECPICRTTISDSIIYKNQ